MIYSIVHSMGIIWGIKGYLLIISVWHSDVIWLTNPLSSEIFAKISWAGLRDHYLLSVIWWFSYLWYSVNELINTHSSGSLQVVLAKVMNY